MAIFLRNVAFHGILLDALFEPGNPDWKRVYDLVFEGIRSGVVQPLQTSVYDRDDVESAFRFMAQGKHIGKVLIKVNISWLFATLLSVSCNLVRNSFCCKTADLFD